MPQPCVALVLHALEQAPNLSIAQAQLCGRFHLRERLLHYLADDTHPPQFLATHHDPVLSDHPTLLLGAGAINKEDISTLAKPSIITLRLQPVRDRFSPQRSRSGGRLVGGTEFGRERFPLPLLPSPEESVE